MLKATAYLGKKDCLFIATNTDAFLPMGSGRNLPGIQFKCNKYPLLNVIEHIYKVIRKSSKSKSDCLIQGTGSLVQGVEVAAQRKAIVCGKPYKPIIDVLIKDQGVDPARTLMIGDR